jgi:hypothetical protein
VSVKLLIKSQLAGLVRRKLNSGWILVDGDIKGIQNLENTIYTPNTKKNRFFEALYLPATNMNNTFFIFRIFFAKKTKDLKKFLKKKVNGKEWENLFHIIFLEGRGNTFKTIIRLFKANQKEETISNYIQKIVERL